MANVDGERNVRVGSFTAPSSVNTAQGLMAAPNEMPTGKLDAIPLAVAVQKLSPPPPPPAAEIVTSTRLAPTLSAALTVALAPAMKLICGRVPTSVPVPCETCTRCVVESATTLKVRLCVRSPPPVNPVPARIAVVGATNCGTLVIRHQESVLIQGGSLYNTRVSTA